jgi:hypothetical protein
MWVAERVQFPQSIVLTTEEALDIVAALEPAVDELTARGLTHLAFAIDGARVIVMDHLLGHEPEE